MKFLGSKMLVKKTGFSTLIIFSTSLNNLFCKKSKFLFKVQKTLEMIVHVMKCMIEVKNALSTLRLNGNLGQCLSPKQFPVTLFGVKESNGPQGISILNSFI